MRRAYHPRHFLAVLIFVAVSAAMTYQASLDYQLSESQLNLAAAAVKRHDAQLFGPDQVFGESNLWRVHTPAFQALMELSLVPTNYSDVLLPFRLLTGAVLMVYLLGMYALCYHQCRSWSISAFVAVLSSVVIHTLGGHYWGLGSLDSITPGAIVQAISPLILLAFLRHQNQWRVMLVFGFVGLCGNMNLTTSINLTLIMLFVYLACRRFAPSAWPRALGCAACAFLGALPYGGYVLGIKAQLANNTAGVTSAVAAEALRLGNMEVLFPELLQSALGWLPFLAVLAIPSMMVLARIERFRVRNLGVWISFLASGIAVGVGAQWVSLWLGGLNEQTHPAFIDFAQAGSLIMLPLYVLFAQGLTNLFRLIRRQRHALRWGCAVLMAAWIIPSDNVRFIRHQIYQLLTLPIADQYKPRNVRRHNQQRAEREELTAIAHWARDNTDPNAIFLCDKAQFRLTSQRAIVSTSSDVLYFYYLRPGLLGEWVETFKQLRRITKPAGKINPGQVRQFVDDLAKRSGFELAESWYLICRTGSAPGQIDLLEQITSDNWGSQYQLFKIR